MHYKQIVSVLVLALVVGLAAWGMTKLQSPQPEPAAPETHVLAGTATTTGLAYTEEHPYYTVSITYPDTGVQNEQTIIEQALKTELADFSSSVADADPSMMPSLAQGYKLALSIDYEKFQGAGQTTSYLFKIYEDTGGAHPNHYFETFTFTPSGAVLALKDLFTATSTNARADYLNRIASIAETDVEGQMRQRLGGDPMGAIFAEGLAPSADNYGNWVLDGSTLRFYFPPYQVAAYAAGDFTVEIPLSNLQDILAPSFR